jgi:PhoPQ-activated pathogenicity-related protein
MLAAVHNDTCRETAMSIAATPRHRWRALLGLACCMAVLLLPGLAAAQYTRAATALRDYVNAPDASYSHGLVASIPAPDLTVHMLTMNSQSWRSAAEIDRPLWQHWVAVIVPAQVRSSTAALIIGGGRNRPQPPGLEAVEIQIGIQLARAAGTVVAVLGQAPNQPLTPASAGVPLSEDGLVAWSWRKAMDTGDWGWAAYLPMVKSAVRAMDTAQSFVPTVSPGTAVERFVVIGFSKRGATTYLTGAVDPRVAAMAPGVFDVLDLDRQLEHHFESLGFYSEAVDDYVDHAIVRRVRAPEGQDLLRVVDPLSYSHLLSMPKFLIHSSGDQFFMPDSGRFYQRDLPGETLLRHVPNTDHSLASSAGITDVVTSLVAWYQRVVAGTTRPRVSSSVVHGRLQVRSVPAATSARLWQATNAGARDFRRVTTGEAWQAEPLDDQGDGQHSLFSARLEAPAEGYTASFIELTFQDANGLPQTYSSRIHVTPDATPFEVVDPFGDPQDRTFWQRQFDVALGAPGPAEIDAATLRSYLPVPLFGDHVTTLEGAQAILQAGRSVRDQARRHCLATRLNIARGELGWYSPVRLLGVHRRPLWWHYQQADQAAGHGLPLVAWVACAGINAARAPAATAAEALPEPAAAAGE